MRVVEVSEQLVIFFLLQRIVLVIVALRALNGHAKHALADRFHAVKHRFHPELLRIDSALFIDHRIAQKARRHNLILCRIRQQVAGNLLDDELAVRQIAIQRVYHVVAIKPHLPLLIFFKAVGIRVARRVQPVASPALTIVRRFQQPVHLFFVCGFAFVIEERIHFFNGWRKTCEVQT